MITTYGVEKNKHSIGLVQNEVSMEELFVRKVAFLPGVFLEAKKKTKFAVTIQSKC